MSAKIFQMCIYHAAFRRMFSSQAALHAPIQVLMPALSPTMEEGAIVKWIVAEGDQVEVGDALCEVETDKAVVSVESMEEGVMAKILVPEGTKNIEISRPIAIMAEEGEDVNTAAKWTPSTIPQLDKKGVENSGLPSLHLRSQDNASHSPAVRQALQHYHIDASAISATGPKGRILKGDILKFVRAHNLQPRNHMERVFETTVAELPEKSQPVSAKRVSEKSLKSAPVQPSPESPKASSLKEQQQTRANATQSYDDVAASGVRKVIARRLTESKRTIPHSYSSVDCAIGDLQHMLGQFRQDGVKLSLNDFVIKAAASALRQVPQANAVWVGDDVSESSSCDVAVAVATDGGLITPIVKNAEAKGLAEIASEVRELARRARAGKLQPGEYQGGSFTISNLGMFGVREFTAVINPPQTCILAVGGSRLAPAPSCLDADDDDDDVEPTAADRVMTVTLSSDARVVDDVTATRFLADFKRKIENPRRMLLC